MNNNQININDLLPKPKEVKDKSLPQGVKLKLKESWCPYCSMPVILQKYNRLKVMKCPNCGISDGDFWVKLVNSKKK